MTLARVHVIAGDDQETIAEVSGEIDAANADDVMRELELSLRSPDVTLDLTRLEYLDSAGVRALFELARSAETRRSSVTLVVAPDSPIRRVLSVSGVDAVFRISTGRRRSPAGATEASPGGDCSL